jgi:1-deoxy-D-xylulose-5-phosphate reductoisomerase
MHKRIIVLGSTGSIGRAALEVAAALNDQVRVVGLAARQGWQLVAKQAARFAVPTVAIAKERHYDELKRACPPGTRVLAGKEGLVELVSSVEADFVLAAIVGAAGLPATLAAVQRGLDVGLANKESLVVAGSLLMPLARENGSYLIPVDSEHSAVFQALMSGQPREVHRIYLTASGGPFRTWPPERIERATVAEALQHPTWSMGPKITIDSATMMNKALEVIEATHLFGVSPNQVEVLVHPESIVHSMVEFCDGSLIAQLGAPDMRTPIQYAITYPQRVPGIAARLDWREVRRLHFEPPDAERFPALRLGYEAARRGGTSGAVLNAANEAAVQRFREGTIPFGEVIRLTERVHDRHRCVDEPTLEQLMEADAWARAEVNACIHA